MEKVLLGMSGGVDSSASAVLLKEAGYEVIGATMKLFETDEDRKCNSNKAIEDAKKVCELLNIEHHVIDLKDKFKCNVIDNFISEYENARTPNPCVECNKHIKFKAFYEEAQKLGCKYVATGHYAKKEYSEKYSRFVLRKSKEEKKDQTYFLYNIPKQEVEYIIFPLEDNENKEMTRQIARENNLEVADKSDSQEICFIPDNDYSKFLKDKMNKLPKSGNIVLKNGKILGKHTGLINYTIGQRKGLGIAYPVPLYVVGLNSIKNEVIVGEEKDLYSNTLYAVDCNFIAIDEVVGEITAYAKIRYRALESKCIISKENENKVKVVFYEPQRAITPGQSVVFYDEDGIVLGGGKII